MPRGPVLTVIVTSATEGLDKGLTVAEKKISKFGAAAGKVGKIAKVAAPIAGVAAVVAKLGAAGDKANTNMASFAKAMEEAGASSESMSGEVNAAVKASQALAFSGQDTRDALVALTTATGDATKSTELLQTAQDLARFSGADLTTTADAVAKAYAGNDRALRALVPGVEAGATAMDTIANAQAAASGQAEIFGNSAEALGIKTKTALKGIAISVGKTLAPAFREMLEALLPIITALGELVTALLPALVPLLNTVAKAFTIVANVITKVVETITKLINKVKELLGPLGDALDKVRELNPFANGFPGGNTFVAASAPTALATSSGGGFRSTGGVTININGDPAVIEAKVTKALRDYARRNGAGSVFSPGRS